MDIHGLTRTNTGIHRRKPESMRRPEEMCRSEDMRRPFPHSEFVIRNCLDLILSFRSLLFPA